MLVWEAVIQQCFYTFSETFDSQSLWNFINLKIDNLNAKLTFFPYPLFKKHLRTQFKCFLKTVSRNIKWPHLLVWALQYTIFNVQAIYQQLLQSFLCGLCKIFFVGHFLCLFKEFAKQLFIWNLKTGNRDTSFVLFITFHINFYIFVHQFKDHTDSAWII